ncbi:hypothetical protein D9757_005255 [Collybiopsis confluens]|uniref:Oxo-4-hydroxy-4-carboxy-5-ureidoimidazoline decarboxylase domain-containing protein n=1 Tax=Collybiopsis confluens TaxID=2823264 RepID=A0A8H5ME02_9AGAR|nr:hypothetical protein D9757_005255 [Collybiopsis confluens]
MSSLPSPGDLSTEYLATTLSTFFEPSPVLISTLVPQVYHSLIQQQTTFPTYNHLITLSISIVRTWDVNLQAQFIHGHPKIGETQTDKMSRLSLMEQSGGIGVMPPSGLVTPPVVLARLAHLNAYYERRYPGLVYIIFVNGRSRQEIVRVLEDHLGLAHIDVDGSATSGGSEEDLEKVVPIESGSKEWLVELDRALTDIELIAKNRAQSME